MFNKDIIHPQMRRKVENPRVILLHYIKKENSKQILNLQKTHDFSATLEEERKEVKALCDQLIALKPDVVVTEKGTSDLATHYLQNVNVSVIRPLTKKDNNLLAKVIGAVIVNRLEELQESDVGTKCVLFEIKKIGDEYYSYFIKCKEPKQSNIIKRSK